MSDWLNSLKKTKLGSKVFIGTGGNMEKLKKK